MKNELREWTLRIGNENGHCELALALAAVVTQLTSDSICRRGRLGSVHEKDMHK